MPLYIGGYVACRTFSSLDRQRLTQRVVFRGTVLYKLL